MIPGFNIGMMRNGVAAASASAFVATIQTSNTSTGSTTSTQFKPPTISTGTYNCNIDWGDGSDDDITAYDDAALTHTYAGSGEYTVTITGQFEGCRFNNSFDKLKLLEIISFGPDFRLGTSEGFWFYGCANLVGLADDLVTSGLTSMFRGFRDSGLVTFPSWNLAEVTDASQIAYDCPDLVTVPNLNMPALVTASSAFAFDANLVNFGLLDAPMVENMSTCFYGCTLLKSLATGQGTALGALTNGSNMFFGTTLDTEDYSRLLEEIEAVNSNSSVPFHGGSSKYNATNGATARAALIADHSWSISDGGAA